VEIYWKQVENQVGLVWFGLEGSEFKTINAVEEVMELKVEEVMEWMMEEVMECGNWESSAALCLAEGSKDDLEFKTMNEWMNESMTDWPR